MEGGNENVKSKTKGLFDKNPVSTRYGLLRINPPGTVKAVFVIFNTAFLLF